MLESLYVSSWKCSIDGVSDFKITKDWVNLCPRLSPTYYTRYKEE